MKIKTFINGELSENCYLVYDDKNALIIDPGNIMKELELYISNNNLKVLSILITHYHYDHTGGLEYYKNLYNVGVTDYRSNKNQVIGNFKFKIIESFGHTMDSVCFYFDKENIMFTGDFIFKNTIGNYKEKDEIHMYKSLNNIIKYPQNIIIYPGHDERTTLESEIINNPYLRGIK